MKANSKSKAVRRFVATIYELWRMRHVDVPDAVARSMAKELRGGSQDKRPARGARSSKKSNTMGSKYVPVVATVNGQNARVTLVPAGGGRYRIQPNTALRPAPR